MGAINWLEILRFQVSRPLPAIPSCSDWRTLISLIRLIRKDIIPKCIYPLVGNYWIRICHFVSVIPMIRLFHHKRWCWWWCSSVTSSLDFPPLRWHRRSYIELESNRHWSESHTSPLLVSRNVLSRTLSWAEERSVRRHLNFTSRVPSHSLSATFSSFSFSPCDFLLLSILFMRRSPFDPLYVLSPQPYRKATWHTQSHTPFSLANISEMCRSAIASPRYFIPKPYPRPRSISNPRSSLNSWPPFRDIPVFAAAASISLWSAGKAAASAPQGISSRSHLRPSTCRDRPWPWPGSFGLPGTDASLSSTDLLAFASAFPACSLSSSSSSLSSFFFLSMY